MSGQVILEDASVTFGGWGEPPKVYIWPQVDGFDPEEPMAVIGRTMITAERIAMELKAAGVDATNITYGTKFDDQKRMMVLDTFRLDKLPNEERVIYHPSGINGLEPSLRWRAAELCVVAGPYGSGKSLFSQMLVQDWVLNVAPKFDEPGKPATALIYAFEDDLRDIREDFLRRMRCTDNPGPELLSRTFGVAVDPDRDRLVSDFLELVRQHRKVHNTRFFVLDPWNELDHERNSKQGESEYVREVLKACRRAMIRYGVVIVLVTHVSSEFIGNDGALKPFRIAHAFGSSQYGNKADRGFCVCRTKKFANEETDSHMVVRADKIKKEDRVNGHTILEKKMGRKRTMVFKYSSINNQIYYDSSASSAAADVWKD